MTALAFAAPLCTALHQHFSALHRIAPAPQKLHRTFFYYTDDDFISELLFISIWQGFSQYFAKKLIKIMLKIDCQANIAKK